MNLVFVSTGSYPDQRAAAIRHSTLVQGVAMHGHKVCFFLLSPQNWSSSELLYKGIFFNSLNTYKGKNKILHSLYFLYALLKLVKKVKNMQKEKPIDGIIIYTINLVVIRIFLSIGKSHNIRILHERTELPYVIGKSNSFLGRLKYKYYLNFLIPKFDGLYVISDKLRDFFLPYNNKIEKILTVVDTNFFNSTSTKYFDFNYIAYCGTMRGNKDGVPLLIRAFARIILDFPDYKLVLIGDNSDQNSIKEVINTICNLKIKDKVIFTGLIDREDMPKILGNAKLLVVSKPDNEQNSGNFPIKVGEYLSTGIPVVVTNVGEISKFITDGENGFLAVPDSIDSFFSKMKEALIDYNRAKVIGLNGRALAEKHFDFKIQSKKMTDYINKLN